MIGRDKCGRIRNGRLTGQDLEHVRRLGVVARPSKSIEMPRAKNFGQRHFVCVDPSDGGQTPGRAINTLGESLFKDDGDKTGEQALDEVQDVVDGRAYFSDRLENVAVKDHLPLDSSFGSEERGCIDRER